MIEGNVDLVWASPLCTHYSRARTTARTPRNLEGSDALVRKCFDLADKLFCHHFIENLESGVLKTRDVVARIPYRIVDYCVYADERFAHRARKRTALWTNTNWKPSRPLCNTLSKNGQSQKLPTWSQRLQIWLPIQTTRHCILTFLEFVAGCFLRVSACCSKMFLNCCLAQNLDESVFVCAESAHHRPLSPLDNCGH